MAGCSSAADNKEIRRIHGAVIIVTEISHIDPWANTAEGIEAV